MTIHHVVRLVAYTTTTSNTTPRNASRRRLHCACRVALISLAPRHFGVCGVLVTNEPCLYSRTVVRCACASSTYVAHVGTTLKNVCTVVKVYAARYERAIAVVGSRPIGPGGNGPKPSCNLQVGLTVVSEPRKHSAAYVSGIVVQVSNSLSKVLRKP